MARELVRSRVFCSRWCLPFIKRVLSHDYLPLTEGASWESAAGKEAGRQQTQVTEPADVKFNTSGTLS